MLNEQELQEPRNYQIIKAQTIRELERAVRIAMLSDWTPQGGLAVDEDGFYQAMVPRGDD